MMSSGIKVVDSVNVQLIGNIIEGFDIGVEVQRVTGLDASGNVISKCSEAAMRLDRVTELVLRNNIVMDAIPKGIMDEAIGEILAADPADAETILKNSRFGRWLSEQSFVEWANLAATILSAAI